MDMVLSFYFSKYAVSNICKNDKWKMAQITDFCVREAYISSKVYH